MLHSQYDVSNIELAGGVAKPTLIELVPCVLSGGVAKPTFHEIDSFGVLQNLRLPRCSVEEVRYVISS